MSFQGCRRNMDPLVHIRAQETVDIVDRTGQPSSKKVNTVLLAITAEIIKVGPISILSRKRKKRTGSKPNY